MAAEGTALDAADDDPAEVEVAIVEDMLEDILPDVIEIEEVEDVIDEEDPLLVAVTVVALPVGFAVDACIVDDGAPMVT